MKPLKKPLWERVGEPTQVLHSFTRGLVFIVKDGLVVYAIAHQMMWDKPSAKFCLQLAQHYAGEPRKVVNLKGE